MTSDLERLPVEILSVVFTNLKIKDFLNLAACSKTLHDVSLLDSVWQNLIQKAYGIKRGKYTKYAARLFFEKMLYPYHKMLGYWTMDDTSYYGGLLKISLEQGGDIICQEVFAPSTCEQLSDDVEMEDVFRISIDDSGEYASIACLRDLTSRYNTQPSEDNCAIPFPDDEKGLKRLQQPFLVQLLDSGCSGSSTLSIICRECCSCTYQGRPPLDERRDLRFLQPSSLNSRLFLQDFAQQRNNERFQYMITANKISLAPPPLPPTVSIIDTGVFKGTYSIHEVELILFQYTTCPGENGAPANHAIQGLKLTGDSNIPAGKITFKANLKDRIVLSSAQDNHNLDFLKKIDCCEVIEDTPQPFASSFICDVPDFDFPKTCIARLKAKIQVSEHEYKSPSFIDAHFIVFSQNLCALMTFDFEDIMLFERVKGLGV